MALSVRRVATEPQWDSGRGNRFAIMQSLLWFVSLYRLSGLENGLLGLSSRNNAVMWSRSVTEIENVDIVCFGHLLYEMCTGQEMTTPKPSMRVLEMELQHYPQIGQVKSLNTPTATGRFPYFVLHRFWTY